MQEALSKGVTLLLLVTLSFNQGKSERFNLQSDVQKRVFLKQSKLDKYSR
jgi:hypothetical protein